MPNQHRPWPDLALLDLLLDREGMARDPEVWTNIHRILLSRIAARHGLQTPEAIARVLGPLVCKSPLHQKRIVPVIEEWLYGAKTSLELTLPAATKRSAFAKTKLWLNAIRRLNKRLAAAALIAMTLLFLFVFAVINNPQPQKADLPPPVVPLEPTTPPIPPAQQTIAITNRVDPNPLPAPVVIQEWQPIYWVLVDGLPLLTLLVWFVWRYQGRTILRKQQRDDDNRITGLRIKDFQQSPTAPFASAKTAGALSPLLRPVWIESKDLNVPESVIATANYSGFFTPVYRQRMQRPEYLILVQSVHGHDQIADVAELFIQALQSNQINIRGYRFRDDPRRLVPIACAQPEDDAGNATQSLAQLVKDRRDARLIVISDWTIVFEPYGLDKAQPWLKELDTWEKRIWLSPGYENQQWAERAKVQAQRHNIRLLPLSSHNAQDIARWLTQETDASAPLGQTEGKILPASFSETAETWLSWRPPHGADLKRLLKELRTYLGPEGFLLLQALAVFPKPLWPLPYILDVQLSALAAEKKPKKALLWRQQAVVIPSATPAQDLQNQQQETRLLNIGRLPWSRHAFMPDYIRERLLKALNRADRKKIRLAWTALLAKTAISQKNEVIDLPIALPKITKVQIINLLVSQSEGNALDDPIFANILLGGKLGLLDFRLPRAMAKLLPNTGKWLDLRPALAAFLFAGLSVWWLNWAWQTIGKQALTEFQQTRILQENALWQIELKYQPDVRILANTLQKELKAVKFPVTATVFEAPLLKQQNTISYAIGGKAVAQRVEQSLAWLSYKAAGELNEAPGLPANTIKVQLNQTYQHTAGFNDELRHPYQQPEKPRELNPNSLAIEPDMVVIKPGNFMTGSGEKEPGRISDEGPQHEVTIASPFAIGKTEVTFAEYDRFAEATGRALPDDNKWGRGKRPVINVSFNDAQAYLRWLAQQTGKNYRLPTEAEWEYAARAGTQTAFWWGNNIGKNNANCNGCGSQWDNRQTAPVGSFKANRFGLFDTAGNVWEWTQDCWHENYKQAPGDGSAWLESDGGDCDRRVVRGGSWKDGPQDLRSAGRLWFYSDFAFDFLGFRVARAL